MVLGARQLLHPNVYKDLRDLSFWTGGNSKATLTIPKASDGLASASKYHYCPDRLLHLPFTASYNTPHCEVSMPFPLLPCRRLPVQYAVTYNVGPFLTLALACCSGLG